MITKEGVKRGIILDSIVRENLSEGIIFYHRPERNEEMNQENTRGSSIPDRSLARST